jgi:hypothetical protein
VRRVVQMSGSIGGLGKWEKWESMASSFRLRQLRIGGRGTAPLVGQRFGIEAATLLGLSL